MVEDEPLVLLSICEELASEGYEVLSAANADQAIEILQSRNDINTVFTDVEMPGSMDGWKLAAAVRDRWPPINIVITSGKSSRATRRCPGTLGSLRSRIRRRTSWGPSARLRDWGAFSAVPIASGLLEVLDRTARG
jgi:two-component system, response regulator PdtaR